ncbi:MULTISPECIES: YnbE family lipoprotein [Marinobacter]|uniref:YnbE family lipoprotein n=1 Tax=Marinobacter TaxID=2742 RepID=UPI000C36149E|nr:MULTISPECIES: YnbE family lipoprotein [Marinobacter]MAO14913.1 YnbE family lipoprotein [Marinobacter sp.]MCD1628580.1 YnbE family lipoprotein [Marinobacter shengliensis]|tara:strand:+ start:1245 stop:1460 length:216 start_codon:yes stop_codon:yes gene_type:complete
MINVWRSRRPLAMRVLMILVLPLAFIACTPTVQMAAPKEPITVNLNVKIQHEIYVKVDREVDELFSDKGLF